MGAIPEYAGGEVIANKYVVDRPLGDGPNGRVYLADSGLGSPKLCVKLFRADLSARLLSAPDFFLKAGVAAEIEHDNLVASLEVQEEMGHVYVARSYVDGLDFEAWLRRNQGEGNYYTRGLELLWQACQGLTALHERTRHLNIHPGNLFITPLQAKLADWDPRSLGNMEMTPDPMPFRPQYAGYRAPEMSGGGGFLSYPSTDLFAVAGLLYRLVLGEHPTDSARSLAGIRGLEKDLGSFLAKAMHPKPEERYQDASAFADALWDLQGAMQRLQESRQSPPARESKSVESPASGLVSPTLAMSPGETAARFGNRRTPAPEPVREDTFFGLFPGDAAPGKAAAEARPEPVKSPNTPKAPPAGDTFFGSLEQPGTRFGAEPVPPPRPAQARGSKSGGRPPADARPAPVSLSSLEKDDLDAGLDAGPAGHTQFGFKGAGDNRTLFAEGGKLAGQRKLMIALGALGALVLVLALGGLFVYLHSTAAPEIPTPASRADADAPGAGDEPVAAGNPDPATPGSGSAGTPEPAAGNAAPVAEDGPPFPLEEAAEGTGGAPAQAADAAHSGAARPAAAAGGAAKGSPERLAELMAMVGSRQWPPDAKSRLQAADELNDFGKVAEANLLYGRAAASTEATEKQRIAALGGLAVTFYSMGMKPQAADAIARILELNPRNAFALKFREKLQ